MSLLLLTAPSRGGGATLQAGIRQYDVAHRQENIACWACEWTDDELSRLGVKRGDPAGQARLEALTLLRSVHTWSSIIRESMGSLFVMGDALGVLRDARKFRAKDATLNELMAELALVIAPLGLELQTVHLWTQRNKSCDALSRLSKQHAIPEELRNVQRCSRRNFEFKVLGN